MTRACRAWLISAPVGRAASVQVRCFRRTLTGRGCQMQPPLFQVQVCFPDFRDSRHHSRPAALGCLFGAIVRSLSGGGQDTTTPLDRFVPQELSALVGNPRERLRRTPSPVLLKTYAQSRGWSMTPRFECRVFGADKRLFVNIHRHRYSIGRQPLHQPIAAISAARSSLLAARPPARNEFW